MLFQVKPSSAVGSSRDSFCMLLQVKPISAGCFKSSQALQVVSSQAKLNPQSSAGLEKNLQSFV
jgi:hypothetical protein